MEGEVMAQKQRIGKVSLHAKKLADQAKLIAELQSDLLRICDSNDELRLEVKLRDEIINAHRARDRVVKPILNILRSGPACISEICRRIGSPLSAEVYNTIYILCSQKVVCLNGTDFVGENGITEREWRCA